MRRLTVKGMDVKEDRLLHRALTGLESRLANVACLTLVKVARLTREALVVEDVVT